MTPRRTPTGARRLAGLLSSALSCALALAASPAHPAVPGRTDAADLVRLRAYTGGRVEAAGPSLGAAIDAQGGFGFGDSGCDSGFAYRQLIHPQASVRMQVPPRSTAVDVILRPAHGIRDLTVEYDGNDMGTIRLLGGWQRVTLAWPAGRKAQGLLRLTLSSPSRAIAEGPTMPQQVRGLLHAVVPLAGKAPEVPTTQPLAARVAAGDVLWMQAGEVLEVPLPQLKDLALETDGVLTRGDGVTVRAEVRRGDGKPELLRELPAALAIPWNLDISRPDPAALAVLRIEVLGREGAVGLRRPRLTVPNAGEPAKPDAEPEDARGRPVVIVAVPGLGAATEHDVPRTLRLTQVSTTSHEPRAALASLLTGLHPAAHGVNSTSGKLAATVPTLLATHAAAGHPAWLFSAGLTGGDRDLARGALLRHAGPKTFPPDPADLFEAALRQLRAQGSERPMMVIVTPEDAKPTATLEALDEFVGKALRTVAVRPLVVVVGLGAAGVAADAPPDASEVAVWVAGLSIPKAARSAASDLTDVAATIGAAIKAPLKLAQGSDLQRFEPSPWGRSAITARGDRGWLIRQGSWALTDQPDEPPTLWQLTAGAWKPAPEGAEGWRALLGGMLRAFRAFPSAWVRTWRDVGLTGDAAGYVTPCEALDREAP